MEEETKTEEYEIEPVEIRPEAYATNLFGESAGPESFSKNSSDVPPEAWPEFSSKLSGSAFNIFLLTDAIGARDKRDAWVLYRKALSSGMVPEEVFYKLVWQVKTLLIAQKTKSVAETEMKPFPYNKAKGCLKNFKPGELEKLSAELVNGYHRVRRGEGEMETLVERFLLKL